MRLALYTFIFLGSVLLALDLAKKVRDIEPAALPKSSVKAAEKSPHTGHSDIQKALTLYTKAIKKSPENPEAYINRANAYSANRQYSEALKDIDYAIQLAPTNTDYLLQRGYIFLNIQQPDKAISNFSKALEINPEFITALIYRAMTNYRSQNFQPALNDYLLILKKDPTFINLNMRIAQCYHELGKPQKALEHIKIYLQTTKNEKDKKEAETLLNAWTQP